jgi:signal peptidase II
MNKQNLNWLWLSVIIIIIDQVTKVLIEHHLAFGEIVYVTSFFNIDHLQNFGAAFSFLNIPGGQQRWMFSLVSFVISIILIIWLLRLQSGKRSKALALALIIGGALSNFWDRFVTGFVIDFLDFHYGELHWPSFNIADSAVCVGAAILIISLLRGKK